MRLQKNATTAIAQLVTAWRSLNKADVDTAKLAAEVLLELRGNSDAFRLALREQSPLRTDEINELHRFAKLWITLPDTRVWLAVGAIGIAHLARIPDDDSRRKAAREILKLVKRAGTAFVGAEAAKIVAGTFLPKAVPVEVAAHRRMLPPPPAFDFRGTLRRLVDQHSELVADLTAEELDALGVHGERVNEERDAQPERRAGGRG